LIAEKGHTLVTGACPGIPYEAVLAANEIGGKVIGYSPAKDEKEHIEKYGYPVKGFDKIHYTGLGKKGRNILNVRNSDAVVIISGRIGTLNEFTIAYDMGKRIGVLKGSGGITDLIPEIVEVAKKKTDAKIIYSENPEKLMDAIAGE
jgi:uncharacterized protein (TIGR00725 family)